MAVRKTTPAPAAKTTTRTKAAAPAPVAKRATPPAAAKAPRRATAPEPREEARGGSGLFKKFSESGGGYFRAKSGAQYLGQFKGTTDGGTGGQYDGKMVWWHFDLYKVSDPSKRVMYRPEEGPDKGQLIPATSDGMTSDSTGPKSKAREWFLALINRELQPGEEVEDVYDEALDQFVRLSFGPSKSDPKRVVLKSVSPWAEDEDEDDLEADEEDDLEDDEEDEEEDDEDEDDLEDEDLDDED